MSLRLKPVALVIDEIWAFLTFWSCGAGVRRGAPTGAGVEPPPPQLNGYSLRSSRAHQRQYSAAMQ